MCGILGIAFQNGCTFNNNEYARYLLRELLQEVEIRGLDATGVAFTNKNDIVVFKAPMAASDLIKTREFNAANRVHLDVNRPDGTISVIGHCRAPTKGSPRVNHNNHPIVTENIVGVHNGEIDNDDALFDKFDFIKRIGRVDSEVIFQLIDYFANKQHTSTAGAIKQTSRLIRGSYACAMVERKNPYLLWLFRRLGPLVVYHYSKVGVIVFASGESYIGNATQGMGLEESLGEPELVTVSKYSGICINLFSNSIRRFKLDEGLSSETMLR